MKKFYITTILSVIASLFVIISNQQVCLPDGCFFAPQNQVCIDGNCINEDMGSHLQERASFLMVIVRDNQTLIQLSLLFFVFVLLLNRSSLLLQFCLRFKALTRNYSSGYNILIDLFAKGVLHPKIY